MTLSVSILLLLFIRCLLTTIITFALPGVSVLVAVEVWSLGKTSIMFSAFSDFSATIDVCGTTKEQALYLITELEQMT